MAVNASLMISNDRSTAVGVGQDTQVPVTVVEEDPTATEREEGKQIVTESDALSEGDDT